MFLAVQVPVAEQERDAVAAPRQLGAELDQVVLAEGHRVVREAGEARPEDEITGGVGRRCGDRIHEGHVHAITSAAGPSFAPPRMASSGTFPRATSRDRLRYASGWGYPSYAPPPPPPR